MTPATTGCAVLLAPKASDRGGQNDAMRTPTTFMANHLVVPTGEQAEATS